MQSEIVPPDQIGISSILKQKGQKKEGVLWRTACFGQFSKTPFCLVLLDGPVTANHRAVVPHLAHFRALDIALVWTVLYNAGKPTLSDPCTRPQHIVMLNQIGGTDNVSGQSTASNSSTQRVPPGRDMLISPDHRAGRTSLVCSHQKWRQALSCFYKMVGITGKNRGYKHRNRDPYHNKIRIEHISSLYQL